MSAHPEVVYSAPLLRAEICAPHPSGVHQASLGDVFGDSVWGVGRGGHVDLTERGEDPPRSPPDAFSGLVTLGRACGWSSKGMGVDLPLQVAQLRQVSRRHAT